VAGAFRAAGFAVSLTGDIDAWLKTHAFFVTAVCGAIYLAGGDCGRLSQDTATLTLMSRGVREGFAAMRALGLGVRPFPLRILFTWLPTGFAVNYWRRFFASKMADYVFGRHARFASLEMRALANDCRTLLEQSGVTAVALKELYSAIEAYRAQT
jgi:2-dehydropantoate 2-reductase